MWEKVPMCSIGGAVCVPLCKNIIDDFEDYNDSSDVRAAWSLWDKRHKENRGYVTVAFTHGHTHAEECGLTPLKTILKIGAVEIHSIDDIGKALKQTSSRRRSSRHPCLTNIEMANNETIVVDMCKLLTDEGQINAS